MNRVWIFVILLIPWIGCDPLKSEKPEALERKKIVPSVPAGESGSTLPAFEMIDLYGHELRSADLKDKVVLIDFWAPWCAPCRQEMPGFQQLLDRYGKQGFVVIGLKADVMADTEDPIHFAREIGVTYPIAVGSADIRRKFGEIQGLPTTFIYDRQGILRHKVIGFEYTAETEAAIKPLL